MRIQCRRIDFCRTLKLFARAILPSKLFTLLGNVRIETTKGGLRLTATDLDLGIEWFLDAVIKEEGCIVVPFRPLLNWIQDQPITEYVSLAEEKLPCGEKSALFIDDQFAFFCQNSSLFPSIRYPTKLMTTIRISAPLLKRIILQVVFASSREAHPAFSYIWLHCNGPSLTFSASDGSRCALNTVIANENIGQHLFLTPTSTLKRMARVLPRKGFVNLEVDQKKSLLCVRTDNGAFLARQYYPDPDFRRGKDPITEHTQGGRCRPFEGYLPKIPQTHVVIEKQALKGILKKKTWPVYCSLQQSAGQSHLELVIYRPNESVTHTIPVIAKGPPFSSCWISLRSLADALSAPGTTSRLRLEFGSPGSNAIALSWMERDGSARTGYAYAFGQVDPISVLHHPQVRRSLSTHSLQFLEQWPSPPEIGRWKKRIAPYLRRETAVLIVSMLVRGIRPTEEQIEQSKKRIEPVSMHVKLYGLAGVCRERNHLARELAIGAFASDGSSLEVDGESISFVAAEIAQALASSIPE